MSNPEGYRKALRLMEMADLLLTDSGGVQEEVHPFLGIDLSVFGVFERVHMKKGIIITGPDELRKPG